jgi:hypothetical protein
VKKEHELASANDYNEPPNVPGRPAGDGMVQAATSLPHQIPAGSNLKANAPKINCLVYARSFLALVLGKSLARFSHGRGQQRTNEYRLSSQVGIKVGMDLSLMTII